MFSTPSSRKLVPICKAAVAITFLLITISQASAIYLGSKVPPRAFPFMVSLRMTWDGYVALCGGTLISSSWVLTAAHCLAENPVKSIVVFAGSDKQWQGDEIPADRWSVHPGFDINTVENDIALIHLSRSPRISPIATVKWSSDPNRFPDAPTLSDPQWQEQLAASISRDVTVVGWGQTSPQRPTSRDSDLIPGTSPDLLMLRFRVASSEYCNARWLLTRLAKLELSLIEFGLNDEQVANIMTEVRFSNPRAFPLGAFCASASVDRFGNPIGGNTLISVNETTGHLCLGLGCRGPEFCVDAECQFKIPVETEASDCPGDSGGPILAEEKDGTWTEVGLVSFGVSNNLADCGLTLRPSVYTNIGKYDGWIREVISTP